MRALVVGDGAAVTEMPVPDHPGECRIRVGLAGICGTDLEILKGYAGYRGIPGHEFVGVVEDAGDGDRHWIGKRVVGEINAACGVCDWCRWGRLRVGPEPAGREPARAAGGATRRRSPSGRRSSTRSRSSARGAAPSTPRSTCSRGTP